MKKKSFFSSDAFKTLSASLVCILLGLIVGYIALLIINPSGSWNALMTILKNFFNFPSQQSVLNYFGSTLVKTAPLLMCAISILFAYNVGLFNIGASGQYTIGAGAALFCALYFNLPWYVCMLAAIVTAGIYGAIGGALKAYCNVNEVISGIMLNWIALYGMNMLLTNVKNSSTPYTKTLKSTNPSAILPSLGLDKLFSNNKYVTIAIPLAIIVAVLIFIFLKRSKLGYELKATGLNKNAAKYAGMNAKKNIILTMVISGALAGLAATFLFLTDIEQWSCSQTSVPKMGFNGIAVAFLGGLNPIGSIFSALFIEHITLGGIYVDKVSYCSQISDLISSIIIYACAFVMFFKQCMSKDFFKNKFKSLKRKKSKQGGQL